MRGEAMADQLQRVDEIMASRSGTSICGISGSGSTSRRLLLRARERLSRARRARGMVWLQIVYESAI